LNSNLPAKFIDNQHKLGTMGNHAMPLSANPNFLFTGSWNSSQLVMDLSNDLNFCNFCTVNKQALESPANCIFPFDVPWKLITQKSHRCHTLSSCFIKYLKLYISMQLILITSKHDYFIGDFFYNFSSYCTCQLELQTSLRSDRPSVVTKLQLKLIKLCIRNLIVITHLHNIGHEYNCGWC
jgi:hypothetical protein